MAGVPPQFIKKSSAAPTLSAASKKKARSKAISDTEKSAPSSAMAADANPMVAQKSSPMPAMDTRPEVSATRPLSPSFAKKSAYTPKDQKAGQASVPPWGKK